MSQANNLKVLQFINSWGETGCSEEDFKEFDQQRPFPFHPILLEIMQTGCIHFDQETRRYSLTSKGKEYMAKIKDIKSIE